MASQDPSPAVATTAIEPNSRTSDLLARLPVSPEALIQFVKFALVGISNVAVDFITFWVVKNITHWNWPQVQVIAFVASVSNSFLWNSIWTFKGMGKGKLHEQYTKFLIVNLISFAFNMVLIKAILIGLGDGGKHGHESALHLNIAKLTAIAVATVWNYTLNKKWTFKK